MKLLRVKSKEYGIRYLTEDCRYKIWKMNTFDDCWRLYENLGGRLKLIQCFKYLKDAKKCLKDMLEE